MKKLFWILVCVIIACVAAYALRPGSTLRGQLAGEAFYDSRSTSAWSADLSSEDPETKQLARQSLVDGGKDAIPVLRDLLVKSTSSDWQATEIRSTVIQIMTELGSDANAASADLLAASKDPDPLVRKVVAPSLPAVGIPAADGVPCLIEMLELEPSVEVLRAISKYGAEAQLAIEPLASVLKDKSHPSDIRWNAARTLGKLRENGGDAIPVIVAHLDDEVDTVREHCAEALGDFGPQAKSTMPLLIAKLTDPAYRVRKDAARSLGQIDSDPTVAVPELKKLLDDERDIVREMARDAIKALAPDEPLPELKPTK